MSLYNPHLLARSELLETFVARRPLLEQLVDDLRRGGRQHHLLVGSRGSGKTTLLLRLAAAIEDEPRLAKTCIPLRFPEEQYNVARPSDFWMNAIDALVDALERRGDRAAAQRLEASLAELEPLAEGDRAKRALDILERWAKQARQLIVLLVDNVDLVLDRLASSLWALREALSIDNGLALIGASSRFLEHAIEYGSPFYDFFAVHELGPLPEDEARQLVLRLAERAGTTKVAEVFDRDRGRFKALYVLTGGTPRTLALLHTVLALEQDDRIERDLDGLLDQLTPYYKARFDDLPAQSQVIVDKVALHWDPITAAECQAATHLEINAVSAQLNRLVKSGLLTKVSLPDASKLGFQISERFFNIWYLMRASRRLRRRLAWFVEFLRLFYDEEDLRRRAEELVERAPADSLSSPSKLLAFASAIPDERLRRRLEFRAIELLMRKGVAAIREVMDLEGEDIDLAPIVDRVSALREIREQIVGAGIDDWPLGETAQSFAEKVAGHALWSLTMKRQVAASIGQRNAAERARIVKRIVEDTKELTSVGARLLGAIASGEVPSLEDVARPAELRQVLGLAESPAEVLRHVLIGFAIRGELPSAELVEAVLPLEPTAMTELFAFAIGVTEDVDWPRLRDFVLPIVRRIASEEVWALVLFLRHSISRGRTREALELLVDAGVAERLAPLLEAMRAIADGRRDRLDALAPEMRTVAQGLYDQLGNRVLPVKAPPPRRDGSTQRPRVRQRARRKPAL